jgi:hypothetical protein
MLRLLYCAKHLPLCAKYLATCGSRRAREVNEAGGPGRTRTSNQTVMSGRL